MKLTEMLPLLRAQTITDEKTAARKNKNTSGQVGRAIGAKSMKARMTEDYGAHMGMDGIDGKGKGAKAILNKNKSDKKFTGLKKKKAPGTGIDLNQPRYQMYNKKK